MEAFLGSHSYPGVLPHLNHGRSLTKKKDNGERIRSFCTFNTSYVPRRTRKKVTDDSDNSRRETSFVVYRNAWVPIKEASHSSMGPQLRAKREDGPLDVASYLIK